MTEQRPEEPTEQPAEPRAPLGLRIEGLVGGYLLACGVELLVAVSPKAFPPGKPLELVVLLPEPDAELVLNGRCVASKKRDDGSFDLRVRLTNLRREARAKLLELFP